VKLARFSAILEAYGAAPERWPEGERAAALALTRSSIVAARELAQARLLDNALEASSLKDADADPSKLTYLHARIVAATNRAPPSFLRRWLGFDLAPSQLWPSLAGLALATVLGFAVGVSGLMQTDVNRDADDSIVLPSIDSPAGRT
jgi:hypothetical protein